MGSAGYSFSDTDNDGERFTAEYDKQMKQPITMPEIIVSLGITFDTTSIKFDTTTTTFDKHNRNLYKILGI